MIQKFTFDARDDRVAITTNRVGEILAVPWLVVQGQRVIQEIRSIFDPKFLERVQGAWMLHGDIKLLVRGFRPEQNFDITVTDDRGGIRKFLGVVLTDYNRARYDQGVDEDLITGRIVAGGFETARVSEKEPQVRPLGTMTSCSCDVCKSACSHKPGWFLPTEVEAAAKTLGLSLQEFFDQYLGVDWWEGPNPIFLLAPGLVGQPAGDMYPDRPTGQCRLLLPDGRCRIHGAHPFECREYLHGDTREVVKRRHHDVAMIWKNHQAIVRKLLGEKPRAAPPSDFAKSMFW